MQAHEGSHAFCLVLLNSLGLSAGEMTVNKMDDWKNMQDCLKMDLKTYNDAFAARANKELDKQAAAEVTVLETCSNI